MYLALFSAAAPYLWPWGYTNTGLFFNIPAPIGYRAIDLLVASNQAVFAGSGKKTSTTPDGAAATMAGDLFYGDYPCYYVDIGASISPMYRALGFVDLLVSITMEDAPGISVSGPGRAPYTNGWYMQGDSDKKDSQDYRAMADGMPCEFLDNRFKSQTFYNVNYDYGEYRLTAKSGIRGNKAYSYSGEYVIMRFEVPRNPVRSYSVYLGQNNLAGSDVRENYAGGPGASAYEAHALSYQCNLYVPVLTNTVIPYVSIKSPGVEGVFIERYDDNNNQMRTPARQLWVPARVPITFTGERSFVSNATIVSWEWQIDNDGWQVGGPTFTSFFQNNGQYQVKLRITADNGAVGVNNGVSNETGNNNLPDFCPSALPTYVQVVDPPNQASISECRPNPFIIGQHAQAVIDFTLSRDTAVSVSIFSLGGVLVKNLLTSAGKYPAGYWAATWDGKDDRGNYATEGIYYGVLTTSAGTFLNKIHVLRVK